MRPSSSTGSSSRSLRERQRQERADLILSIAGDVLVEKGYYETTIEEIAARAGIGKGTVYLHFGSKDDLIVALIEQEVVLFSQAVEQASRAPGAVRSRLEQIIHYACARLRSRRVQLFLTLEATVGPRQSLMEKLQGVHTHFDQIAIQISALLDAGKATGEVNTALPTAVMVTSFLSLLVPGRFASIATIHDLSVDELAAAISHIFFQGVEPPSVQHA